jgi:hypothetical protein
MSPLTPGAQPYVDAIPLIADGQHGMPNYDACLCQQFCRHFIRVDLWTREVENHCDVYHNTCTVATSIGVGIEISFPNSNPFTTSVIVRTVTFLVGWIMSSQEPC